MVLLSHPAQQLEAKLLCLICSCWHYHIGLIRFLFPLGAFFVMLTWCILGRDELKFNACTILLILNLQYCRDLSSVEFLQPFRNFFESIIANTSALTQHPTERFEFGNLGDQATWTQEHKPIGDLCPYSFPRNFSHHLPCSQEDPH